MIVYTQSSIKEEKTTGHRQVWRIYAVLDGYMVFYDVLCQISA